MLTETDVQVREALLKVRNIDSEEFDSKMKGHGLGLDRKDLLFRFVRGEVDIHASIRPDVERYALKCLAPEIYGSLPHEAHLYSSGDHYEYDPAKNGQNMVKHGIGFGEVVSYSRKFGRLMVPFHHERDGERWVLFSDLDAGPNGKNLDMPPASANGMLYVLSVAQQREGKFRFISARIMSSERKKYRKTIVDAIKHVFPTAEAKAAFIDRCCEIVENGLIPPQSTTLS